MKKIGPLLYPIYKYGLPIIVPTQPVAAYLATA
jgi:hypothetical protein